MLEASFLKLRLHHILASNDRCTTEFMDETLQREMNLKYDGKNGILEVIAKFIIALSRSVKPLYFAHALNTRREVSVHIKNRIGKSTTENMKSFTEVTFIIRMKDIALLM